LIFDPLLLAKVLPTASLWSGSRRSTEYVPHRWSSLGSAWKPV